MEVALHNHLRLSHLKPNLYSLLYVSDGTSHKSVNLKSNNPIDVYAACASLLHQQALHFGHTFVLITNDTDVVMDSLRRQNLPRPECVEIPFSTSLPRQIPFYEAHFKIDVLRAFSRGISRYPALIDLDVILTRAIDLDGGVLSVFDITQTVNYAKDLQRFGCQSTYWYGGEFIAGPPSAFSALVEKVDELMSIYRSLIPLLNHVGDEAIVSAALNLLADVEVCDLGVSGHVARWWSSYTTNLQPRLIDASEAALLHLPGDKLFLGAQAGKYDHLTIVEAYRSSIYLKVAARQILAPIVNAVSPERRFSPRL